MAASAQEQPTMASVVLATAIIFGLTGYFIGQGKSIGLFGGVAKHRPTQRNGDKQSEEDSDISDAGSDHPTNGEEQELGELQSFRDSNEEFKLVLIVRSDLGMTKGKSGSVCRMPFCFPPQ